MGHARPDHLFGQPDPIELPPSHDSMLPTRQARNPLVKDLRV
jgi:hypothetical protein